jgi:hypothetical protein
VVTRQDKEAVVIVAIEEFERLTRRPHSQRVCRSSLLIRRWQDLASILSENPTMADRWIHIMAHMSHSFDQQRNSQSVTATGKSFVLHV